MKPALYMGMFLPLDVYARGGNSDGVGGFALLLLAGVLLVATGKILERAVGKVLTSAIFLGMLFSFFLGVVPMILAVIAHKIFDFENLPGVLACLALLWVLGCIYYQVYSRWTLIVEEYRKRKGC